jgi:hypothetical protein
VHFVGSIACVMINNLILQHPAAQTLTFRAIQYTFISPIKERLIFALDQFNVMCNVCPLCCTPKQRGGLYRRSSVYNKAAFSCMGDTETR